MQNRSFRPLLATFALAMGVSLTLDAQEPTKPKAKAAPAKKAVVPGMEARTKGKLKPVDINSATKEEISFMLGIDVAIAARIVAGRPYPTKTRLVTNKIVTADVYAAIKDRVYARQVPPPK